MSGRVWNGGVHGARRSALEPLHDIGQGHARRMANEGVDVIGGVADGERFGTDAPRQLHEQFGKTVE